MIVQVDLVRLAPNLASLLLWPHSRRFNSLGPIIAAQLPKLRLLSLDAVHDTGLITLLAETIEVRRWHIFPSFLCCMLTLSTRAADPG